jgi:hypothetical protein
MAEDALQRADPIGLAHHSGMQRQRQDASTVAGRLGVKHVELIAELLRILIFRMAALDQDRMVVDVA